MDARVFRRPLRAGMAVAAIALGLAASFTGCARDRYYSATPEGGLGSRLVRRPALGEPAQMSPKPMFLGGYAGADYNRETRPAPLRLRDRL